MPLSTLNHSSRRSNAKADQPSTNSRPTLRVLEDPPPYATGPATPRKLLDRVRWHLRVKRYSIRTEQAYVDWIRHVKASLTCRGSIEFAHVLFFYVYVLRSTADDGFYIGYTANLRKRFEQHVQGDSFATAYRRPWKLIYYEAYLEEADAIGRERYLKSGAGRRFLKVQLSNYLKRKPITSTA